MNTTSHRHSKRFRVIKQATIVNALGNLLLAFLKLFIGWIGYSEALIADGIHSLTDLLSDGLVYISAYIGNQEPDEEHPYGHKRVETLGAIIIALLLIAIGIYLVILPIWQFLHHAPMHKISWIVLVTAIVSVFINESLFHYGNYFGKKWDSRLLMTNAWHNRSDAMVSVVVVLSSIASMLHWHHFDIIGAMVIGLIIVYSGVKIIYECASELIDTAVDEDTIKSIKQTILEVPEILAVHELRSRTYSGDIYLDLHVQVPNEISVSEGHQIAELVHHTLLNSNHNITDVTVHIDPEDDESEHLNTKLPFRSTISKDIHQLCSDLSAYQNITLTNFHFFQGAVTIDLYFSSMPIEQELSTITERLLTLSYCSKVRFYLDLSKP